VHLLIEKGANVHAAAGRGLREAFSRRHRALALLVTGQARHRPVILNMEVFIGAYTRPHTSNLPPFVMLFLADHSHHPYRTQACIVEGAESVRHEALEVVEFEGVVPITVEVGEDLEELVARKLVAGQQVLHPMHKIGVSNQSRQTAVKMLESGLESPNSLDQLLLQRLDTVSHTHILNGDWRTYLTTILHLEVVFVEFLFQRRGALIERLQRVRPLPETAALHGLGRLFLHDAHFFCFSSQQIHSYWVRPLRQRGF